MKFQLYQKYNKRNKYQDLSQLVLLFVFLPKYLNTTMGIELIGCDQLKIAA